MEGYQDLGFELRRLNNDPAIIPGEYLPAQNNSDDSEVTPATYNDQPSAIAEEEPAPVEQSETDDVQAPEPDQADAEPASRWERIIGAVRRNKVATAAGAITVASLATTPIVSPMGETLSALKEVAPYVGSGMVAAEAVWIGGAAMMLASVGKKMWNPMKIREQIGSIPEAASNSKLFKAGLLANTAGAVAEFVIPTVAVTANMPPQSWGVLAFSTLDLWATVVLRRMIWKGIHQSPEA